MMIKNSFKLIFAVLVIIFSTGAKMSFAEDVIVQFVQNGKPVTMKTDSITFTKIGADGKLHNNYVGQIVHYNGVADTLYSVTEFNYITPESAPYIIPEMKTVLLTKSSSAPYNFWTNIPEEDMVVESTEEWLDVFSDYMISSSPNSCELGIYGGLYPSENTSNDIRRAKIIAKSEKYNLADTIDVIQLAEDVFSLSYEGFEFPFRSENFIKFRIGGNGGELRMKILLELEDGTEPRIDASQNYLKLEKIDGTNEYKLIVPENTTDEWLGPTCGISVRTKGFGLETMGRLCFSQAPKSYPTNEEIKTALWELYDCLDESSKQSLNWSEVLPLWEWTGIKDRWFDRCWWILPNRIDLFGFSLEGKLRKDLNAGRLLDVSILSLDSNYLHGELPDSWLNHPLWNEKGWTIIPQSAWYFYKNGYRKAGFDCDDYKLQITNDYEIDYLDGEKTTLKDVLKKNKITQIFIDIPSEKRINQFLSYKDKGYGIIVNNTTWGGESLEDTQNRIADFYNYVDSKGFDFRFEQIWDMNIGELQGLWNLGSSYLFDSEGRLVEYLPCDGDIPEDWYNSYVDSILQARLGDPLEHQPYVSPETYTSTDYSRDGEVLKVQSATVGKGIDLVFLGDAYVDRDMDEDGKYERDMKEGINYFFEVEPYKSMRDRFNVYIVKVVSPNAEYKEGAEHRINNSDEICFEYAAKAGIDVSKATIVNLENNPNLFFDSAFTNMYTDGASVAHIQTGGPSSIIVHEAGGHGFGKLADEYVFPEGQGQTCDERNKEVWNSYHDRGWHVNLDQTDNPDEICWKHFLNDERYKDEIGIYEGAWFWEFGVWRPTYKSAMNSEVGYSWFNAPSREAIYKFIMQQSEGDDWQYNFEDFVAWDKEHVSAPDYATKAPAKAPSKDKPKKQWKHQAAKIIYESPLDYLKK